MDAKRILFTIAFTRIMINKGMVNKGKYWIFEKNKGISVSNFEEHKGRIKGIKYWISLEIVVVLTVLLI